MPRNPTYVELATRSFLPQTSLSHFLTSITKQQRGMAAVALFHGAVPPPPPVFYLNAPPKARNNSHFHSLQFHRHLSYRCTRRGASSSSSSSWATDFDLYDLLGVDRCSDQFEIKKAYRALQKRCHPDIAGPAGHDMAILLNEIYSVLSDPIARGAYDHVGSMVSNVDSSLLALT